MAKDFGTNKILESHSWDHVKLLKGPHVISHSCENLIVEVRKLVDNFNCCSIHLNARSCNVAADHLARASHLIDLGSSIKAYPSPSIRDVEKIQKSEIRIRDPKDPDPKL